MHTRRPFLILSVTLILGSLLMLPAAAGTARGEATRSSMRSQAGSLMQDGSLSWNSFFGGAEWDGALRVALDAEGNSYITGRSDGTWGNPVNAYAGDSDVFVAKVDSNGALIWNTFLGATAYDFGTAIATDANGDIYVAGYSKLGWGSPVNPYTGDADVFVAKLDSNGALVWNSFLGGTTGDETYAIALDGNGNISIIGSSLASWGNPVHPFAGDPYARQEDDVFVAKLNSSGALVWNTFLGSSHWDYGDDIALDSGGDIYILGESSAMWGSPLNPFSGSSTLFVAKLDSSGALTWNTFLDSGMSFGGAGLALDGAGNIYITGPSPAIQGSPVKPFGGAPDAFVAKLDGSGALVWNTFLTGSRASYGFLEIALDADSNAYITGSSPATWGTPVRPFAGGGSDAFVARVDSAGALTWNTFLGGTRADAAGGIAIDGRGNIFIAGGSGSTWGTPVRPFVGASDAFIAKLGDAVSVHAGSFPSIGLQDGSLLESAETSSKGGTLNAAASTFNLGDDAADRQYRAILSFNTARLPDNAVITKATLKIKRQGIVGTNPFSTHMGLTVDIRKPYFGPTTGLGITDFQALASKTAVATFNKIPTAGAWYSAILNSGAYPYIAKTGLMQFRLRFAKDDNDDRNADYLRFYSGNAIAAYCPVLVLEYYIP